MTIHVNGHSHVPPADVIAGLSQLLYGAPVESLPLDTWIDPWPAVARQVGAANGHRPQVLRECIEQQCGEHASRVAQALFATKPLTPQTDWEPPIAFRSAFLPTFPTHVLPGWLQQFVEAEAEATQTPPDMAAMMALSIISLAMAKKMNVQVRAGWIEPVHLWTLITMESANRKSAVVRDLIDPVDRYQRDELARMAPAIREALARRQLVEERCEQARHNAAKARGEEAARWEREMLELTEQAAAIKVPVAPKLWTDDCTPEMMGTLLAEHEGRMAIISAEGSIFEVMAGRYSKGRPNIGVYLAGHAGDAYIVDRRGRESEYVPNPAITIGLTVQPEVLRSLADRPLFRGLGLLGRFCYSMPASALGSRKSEPQPVPDDVRQAYAANVLHLLKLPFHHDHLGAQAPYIVPLDEAARELMRSFQDRLEPQLGPYGELVHIRDWAGKLCGTVARVAGLLHAATVVPAAPWQRMISGPTMVASMRIAEYLTAHARAAFGEMNADPLVEQARCVLDWLEKKRPQIITQREVFEGVKGDPRLKRMDALRPVLDLLLEHNFLRQKPPAARSGPGRRPTAVYEVNPYFCGRSATT